MNHLLPTSAWKQIYGFVGRTAKASTFSDPNATSSSRPSCPVCSKSFYNSGTLNRHIEIHYLKRKNYKCDMCGKRFSWKNALNAHLRKDHDVDI